MNDEWMEKESRDEEGSGIVCGLENRFRNQVLDRGNEFWKGRDPNSRS
jgi:hypothetical protein